MAIPKVFVSSTCYDLKEIRDNLYEFIDSLGYHPIFSDKNDVFYHPDLHTHEACIKEIENCQLFVLIIGGRFGGHYKYDETRSIVNAEYDAAKKLNLPIFTFVQKDVYSNQFTYTKNQKNSFSEQIIYPSIADQTYAKNIFEFIISLRRSDENNCLFEFEFARDVKAILRKQFAGLFYDFLWNRKKDKESDRIKNILYDLSSISKKTEELIENIYKKVDQNPETLLHKLNTEDLSRRFWYSIMNTFGATLTNTSDDRKQELTKINENETWVDYLLKGNTKFELFESGEGDDRLKWLRHQKTERDFVLEWGKNHANNWEENEKKLERLERTFDSFKSLNEIQRLEILNNIEI